MHGGTSIAGWFMAENTVYEWMMIGMSPISGNLHIAKMEGLGHSLISNMVTRGNPVGNLDLSSSILCYIYILCYI